MWWLKSYTKYGVSKTVVVEVLIYQNPVAVLDTATDELNKIRMLNPRDHINFSQEFDGPLFRFNRKRLDSHLSAISENPLVDNSKTASADLILGVKVSGG
ncbi:hypothetical protein HanXRQr2_Chr01g0009881 [Helianthus annuus]|uniref:Uncharacterized protein n=1 Tax=Helianthus annuus TaxID=4232 RepID=A0A9K3JTM7_HELAN|nr:hypothetical protein HanXRQr2_Chr01g0009881 [Helianthus annuus]